MTSQACKAKEQYLWFMSTKHRGKLTCKNMRSSFRQRSGLNIYTLSRLSINTHMVQETSEYLLWCPHTPPTPSSHRTPSHLDLSSPRLPNLMLSLSTHRLPLYLLLLPTRVQWVVWCQVFVVGCLWQVQTISVFVNVDVWFSNLCLWSGF